MTSIARSHIAGNMLTKFVIHKTSAICDIAMVAMLGQINAAMFCLGNFTILRRCDMRWCDLRCCEANSKINPSQIFRARYSRKAIFHKLTHDYAL